MVLALRVPPDLVALLIGSAMWVATRIGGTFVLPDRLRLAGVFVLLASGVALIVMARVQFARHHTTFSPIDPARASALVVDGVFRLTRNPMYLGTWCLLLALAIYWSNWFAAITSLCFVWYIDRQQIRPEEHVLRSTFGAAYEEYRRRVRRWL